MCMAKDVIKRRLLIEGDSGGDDRRITNLLKTFLRWTTTEESDEQSYKSYQTILYLISQCEHANSESQVVQKVNQVDYAQYEQLSQDIEQAINQTHSRIQECKEELVRAKKVRKHRQEYDNLGKIIEEHPDREKTMRELSKINDSLESLKQTHSGLDSKLEMRRRQFHLLVVALRDLDHLLEDDSELGIIDQCDQPSLSSAMDTN